ncbi:MAG: putative acyltransferase [Actinomycetia bacterium]|nr:putative acyltransferase [Actinomycetes bacterium]
MPEPVTRDQKYLPGLDGLRALAVAAVVAYHLGYGWAQGGLLGVGVFFTLSGYLITDILVGQWAARGRIKLGDFWLRRARRLLPALFVMLAVVTVWVNVFARSFIPGFRGNVVASVFYVSNWWYIGQHSSYYARFAPPTPLDHLWSLAVEEQFYLIWPWVVLLLVWLAGRLRKRKRGLVDGLGGLATPVTEPGGGIPYLTRRSRLALAGVTLALAAGSAILMACLYHPGYDPTRVYEGTDTRACGLLIGAAVAMVWPTRKPAVGGTSADRRVPVAVRWLLDAAGIAGLVVIGLLVWRTNEYSDFMFQGGLVVLSVATAATVAAVVTPGSLLGRALGCRPLRWTGVRSYGIYLWHYPVIVLTAAAGAAGSPVSLGRAAAVVAGTVAAAALSWRAIEEPIRRGARLRWVTPVRSTETSDVKATGGADVTGEPDRNTAGGGWRPSWLRRPGLPRSPQAIGGICLLGAAVLAAGVTASMRLTSETAHPAAQPPGSTASTDNARLSNSAGGPAGVAGQGKRATAVKHGGAAAPGGAAGKAAAGSAHGVTANTVAVSPAAIVPALPTPPPRTSCSSVVHIGDSTSEGLISANYEPNPANRIPARYADVGVKQSIMKIVGATSVVESLPGTPNAYDMANRIKQGGFHGCWVLALGTNDTADVYVGSNVDRVQRVQKMMSVIGKQPVMWVEVTSLLSTGPYSEQNMELWNQALQQVRAQYPNMRIYNWPAIAQKSWFINDGIHYTTLGYAQRATAIADALADAFPAS